MEYKSATNTLRFLLKNPEEQWTRKKFVHEVMFGLLGLSLEEILCLEDHQKKGLFDLTLRTEELCWEKKAAYEEAVTELKEKFELEPIFLLEWRIFFVKMNSAQVPLEDIKRVLEERLILKGELVKTCDSDGVWNKWRKVYGRFKKIRARGEELFLKPVIFVGPNKGIVRYAGQPEVCYKCSNMDHKAAECNALVCRNCNGVGHLSKDCPEKKRCNLCGEEDHLYRDCSKRARSYAEAASGRRKEFGKKDEAQKEKSAGGVASSWEGGTAGKEETKERGGARKMGTVVEKEKEVPGKKQEQATARKEGRQGDSSSGMNSSQDSQMDMEEIVERRKRGNMSKITKESTEGFLDKESVAFFKAAAGEGLEDIYAGKRKKKIEERLPKPQQGWENLRNEEIMNLSEDRMLEIFGDEEWRKEKRKWEERSFEVKSDVELRKWRRIKELAGQRASVMINNVFEERRNKRLGR